MSEAIHEMLGTACRLVAPPKPISISKWAETERHLSPEASAEPGRWRNERTPYLVEPMDCLCDPEVESVVIMAGTQVAKTEFLLNSLGYYADIEPSPILLVQPTIEIAEAFSHKRLATMIRDTPRLAEIFPDSKTRDSGQRIKDKSFPGGHITLAGANSPSSLCSRPIRILLMDEVDRWPIAVGGEGDPVELAKKRTATFWNKKLAMVSSPTIKNLSKIERAYLQSSRGRWHLPCPKCRHKQPITWAGIVFEGPGHRCVACGQVSDEVAWKSGKGTWVHEDPGNRVRGFHVPGLISPWTTWNEAIQEFQEASKAQKAGDLSLMQVFVNTMLGETWEEQGAQPDYGRLMTRRAPYLLGQVPERGLFLSAAVDVQDNRFAVLVRAWGRGEESFLVEWKEIYCDTSRPESWAKLDDILGRSWPHANGGELKILSMAVDSGGHRTPECYTWARGRAPVVMAIKGFEGFNRAIVGKPSLKDIMWNGKVVKQNGVQLWPLGVDAIKRIVYNRLTLHPKDHDTPTPGAYNWPSDTAEGYFRQLTSEKLVSVFRRGREYFAWHKVRERNEALDCEVYAYAAAVRAGISVMDWDALERATKVDAPAPAATVRARRPDGGSGWLGKGQALGGRRGGGSWFGK